MKKIHAIIVGLILFSIQALAQPNVNINLAVTPPYSTKISDYANNPGKVIITVTYTAGAVGGDLRIILRASITGDNGVVLSTKSNYRPSAPIILQANIPKVVDLQTIADIFDLNSFTVQGITTKDVLEKGGMPEGNYQFCVRAYLWDSPTVPVSAASPLGCTNIRLTQLEPPILVKPFNNENVIANNVQNVIFNWNIPAGAEPGTQYVFRVIEMLDATKNANDAMNSKTTPAFFETTISNNIFLYGPAQPQLVVGRKYAWAVTALLGARGTAYKNNGRSEVRSFIYTEKNPPVSNTIVITTVLPKDNVKLPAGEVGFKWDYDKNTKIKNEELILVEVSNKQTAVKALATNPKITMKSSGAKMAVANLTAYGGKSFAWRVDITDENNKIFSSPIKTFELEEKVLPMVTHIYPKNGESVPSTKSVFHWTYDKSFGKDKTGKDYYPSQLPIIVEVKAGQTLEQAIKNNTNINTASAQNYNTIGIDLSSYAGKKLAWKVDVTYLDKKYSSSIDTFSVINFDESLKNSITQFTINGFPISVKTITNIEGFRFQGTGTTNLYKDGTVVNISFDDLNILPFGVKLKNNSNKVEAYTNWAATIANKPVTATIAKTNNSNTVSIPLKSAQKEVGGNFYFDLSSINFNPFIIAYYDAAKQCFVKLTQIPNPSVFDEAPTITGKFKWKSEISNKENGKVKMAEFLSAKEETFVYSYANKFQPQDKFYTTSINGDVSQVINLNNRTNEELVLSVMMKIEAEDKVACQFSGAYKIKSPTNNKKGIEVWFTNQPKLEFEKTIDGDGWNEILDDGGLVKISFTKASVCLNANSSKTFGVTIPELKLSLYEENQAKNPLLTQTIKNVVFTGANGIKLNYNQSFNPSLKYKFGGFDIASTSLKCIADKTILTNFSAASAIVIPFVNKNATFNFSVDKNGFVKSPLSYTAGVPQVLYNDLAAGDKCTFSLTKATFNKNTIDVNGNFNFSNTTDAEKNMNVANIASPTIAIDFTGEAKFKDKDAEGFVNTLSNPTGVFNGYSLTPMKMALSKLYGMGKYELKLKGILVLADNLGTNTSTENFSTKVNFNDPNPTKTGSSFNENRTFATFKEYHRYQKITGSQDISFSSESKASSDNESSSFTNVGLTFFSGDKDYGTGFKANMSYSLKNPSDPNAQSGGNQSVTAIMWIGHMKESGGYNYWFLEAGQKNLIVIPTGLLDLTINGFKGRVFYHMRHDGDNINDNTTYKPDKSKFIGVFAQVNLKTATDNGIKFWGDLAMEVATNNSGLESIKLLGNGNFISTGEGNAGIIQAKDCKLNMYWSPKKVTGDFNVLFGTDMLKMKTNTGFEISKDVFHVWGNGSGSLFDIEVPGGVGFDLDDKRVLVYGEYKLKQIHWHRDGVFSDDDVYIEAGAKATASLNYSPFHVRASANLYGSASYTEETLGTIGTSFNLNAQLEFPSPTCVSAGISVFGFDFDAGIKDGSIIWGKCWE